MIEDDDYNARVVALQQAAHDARGSKSPSDVAAAAAVYLGFLTGQLPNVDIAAMTDRFLQWRLPDTFAPDAGISFKPSSHPHGWPVGTNLLDASQAKAMLLYVLGIED